MPAWQSPQIWLIALIGYLTLSAALPDLIIWDPLKSVWVDVKTKGVVSVTGNSVTNPDPGNIVAGTAVAAAPNPGWTQQGNTKPQKASDKALFPLVIFDAEYFETCYKNASDFLTMVTTKCDLFKDVVNCQQLAEMGYLPAGVQSFVPGGNLNGGHTLPNGCSSGNLGIEYDGLKMVFNSPQIPILAVIAKDVLSKVYYFGSGVTQGRLLNILMLKAEFCYAPPSISPLYVSKTASYSTGMQPGTAAWNFFKTVALAPPYSNNVASMFRGDSADATWTLSVLKTGTDTVYQGAVSGQITITNPQPVPVTVYGINDYVQGGPQATVSCGTPVPFTIQPCSSSVCNYVGYWPTAPAAGSYTNLADVQYSVGDSGIMGNQVGTALFQVAQLTDAVGMMNTAAGTIPAGQAVVQDAMAPQQYFFSGSTQQSYTTQLTCPDTAIITNQATLTAATGQSLAQTATVQKLCFELQVRVAQAASPFVGKWNWAVQKAASKSSITLKPSATAWDKYVRQQMDLAIASGQDPSAAMQQITGGANYSTISSSTMAGSTYEEVTYTVKYTRTSPGGFVAGAPAFQAVGDVFITNTSPLNAQLKEVQVQITNPYGGLPYTTTAQCPLLTVAAGQTLQCRYVATPSFNPIGGQVTAAAIYLNLRNGVPTGATTTFTSAALTVGGGVVGGGGSNDGGSNDGGSRGGRRLQAATSGPADIAKDIGSRIQAVTQGPQEIVAALGSLLKPNPPNTTVLVTTTTTRNLTAPLAPLNNLLNGIAKLTDKVQGRQQDSSGDAAAAAAIGGQTTVAAVAAPGTASDAVVAPAANAPGPPPVMPEEPTVAAQAARTTYDLQGLSDECVDAKDVFAKGSAYTTGVITLGSSPAGRICDTTTFTYTVRYGPYADCLDKKAINKASFVTADTQTTGAATVSVNVKVQGCGAAVASMAKTYAVWAKKSYTWSVNKDVSPENLRLAPKKVGSATYTIRYQRNEILINPKMSVTVQFDNLAATDSVSLSAFTYKVISQCPAGAKQATGTFKCPASTIPAGGAPLSCQLQFDLPCIGPGSFTAQAAAGSRAIASPSFNFPAPKAIDTVKESQCAIVVDEWSTGGSLVTGKVINGLRPYGKLCGTKEFTYTAEFGPFDTCAKRKATNIASLTTGEPTNAARAQVTLNLDVTGCDVYTPMANRTSVSPKSNTPPSTPSTKSKYPTEYNSLCVSSVSFWKKCMVIGTFTGRCTVVLKLPAGAQTAFYPQPNQRNSRTYKSVLLKPLDTGAKGRDMWYKASQALAAVQLNEIAGVSIPAAVKQAEKLVSSHVSSSSSNSSTPVILSEEPGVASAVILLEKFSDGQAGTPSC